jgi:PAS domain S-box-containing protein
LSDSLDDLRTRLGQYTDGQKLLLQITQRIASGGSVGAMLPDVTNMTLRAAQADGVRIVLDSPETQFSYASGPAAGKMLRFDKRIAQLVTEHGTVAIPDLANPSMPGVDLSELKDGLGAFFALPLTAQNTRHGILWIAYAKPRTFTDEDKTFLSIIAGQTAVAIANASAFETARRGREQLAAILSSSVDPVLVINDKGVVLLLNPSAERAFNVAATTAVGKPVGEVINAEPLVALLNGEATSSDGVEWQNDSGQTFAPRVSDISNEDGQRTGRVLILRDITRYKLLRENQTEFVSTVSHDLRSPLTYMQGYASMLPMVGTLNEKQQGFADKIVLGIAQMTDLVDKILDAGRLDPEGNYELNREPCDVGKVVTDVVANHTQAAEKKKLVLKADMNSATPILNLDNVMIQRALNNLVDNAIKYTPENGTVTVSAAVKDNNLTLSVRDSGLGISQENQSHIFERFRRIRRREHQSVKGSGLGLFIVKSVAQRHGGDAWVESKEGEGSTFSIKIPLEGANLIGAEAKRA